MYTLLAVFIAGGMLCIVEANGRQFRGRVWCYIGAALCSLAAIYTHSLGIIAFIALASAVFVSSLPRPRDLIAWLGTFAGAGGLSLAYVAPIWAYYRSGSKLGAQFSFYSFANPVDIPGTIIAVLIAHRLIAEHIVILIMVPLAAILTFLIWRRYGRRVTPLLVALWVSIAAISGLTLFAHIYKTFYVAPFAPLALAFLVGVILLVPRCIWRGLLLTAL